MFNAKESRNGGKEEKQQKILNITQRNGNQATLRYQHTPVRSAIIQKTQIANVCKDVEESESLQTVSGNVNSGSHCVKQHRGFSKK